MGTDSNETAGPAGVGRVIGTEDATPLGYWFALAPGSTVQLDEVVVTDRALPDGTTLSLSGVVTQVRARHEGARFDSDVFLIEDGVLPAQVAEAAQVTTTRAEPEVFVPPLPGSVVRRAEVHGGRHRPDGADVDGPLAEGQVGEALGRLGGVGVELRLTDHLRLYKPLGAIEGDLVQFSHGLE